MRSSGCSKIITTSRPSSTRPGEGTRSGGSSATISLADQLRDEVLRFERLYREEQAHCVQKDNLVQRLESRSLELAEEKDQVQNTFVPILATIEDRLLKLQQARKSRERLR